MVNISDIRVGDVVKIADAADLRLSPWVVSDMLKYSGMCVTVTGVMTDPRNLLTSPHIHIDEDNGRWNWYAELIDMKIPADDEVDEFDIASSEELGDFLTNL